jgi:hypothetical protein
VLLRDDDDGVIAIGQASHAWISGQLARAWEPPPARHEEVCLAAEQHDVGMAEWDLHPTLNESTGLPHSFVQLPLETHIALWSAAPGKLLSQSAYAALLVSMHGVALQRLRDMPKLAAADRELVLGFLERQRLLQDQLIELLGADREQLALDQRLLWAWDSISLALCLRWPTTTVNGYTLALEGDRFTLTPWPFMTDRLGVRCEGRRLPGRYETEPQLRAALECSPLVQLAFVLVGAE